MCSNPARTSSCWGILLASVTQRTLLRLALPCTWTLLILITAAAPRCAAQGGGGEFGILGGAEPSGQQYPSQEYLVALEIYRSGNLERAVEAFEISLRRSRRDTVGRWIDAIPSHAMLAECYWHLGNLPKVRENVDLAFQIAVRYQGWLQRIEWDSAVNAGVQPANPLWLWPEARSIQRAPVSRKIIFGSGQQLTEQTLQLGGVIEELNFRSMDVVEMMRGLALACYRKRLLMGPLTATDGVASEVVDSISSAGLPQPIAQTLIAAMRASAQFSSGNDKRALQDASRSSLLAGSAHPLSAVSLLVQASLLAESQNGEGALASALAAVHTAGAIEQPELIGEAMQLAAGIATEKEAMAVRATAVKVADAMVRQSRLAALHCYVAAADASITGGDLDSATVALGHAKSLSSHRNVLQPRIDAYGDYVTARLAAARGEAFGLNQPTTVDQAFESMRSYALNHRVGNRNYVSMPSLYQLALISQAIGGRVGNVSGDKMLATYSGDPSPAMWRRDPVDSLAFLMVNRIGILNARLAMAVATSDGESVLIRTDDLLAERFSQSLPLAGRLADVRQLARAAEKELSDDARAFLADGPASLKQLRKSVADARLAAAAEDAAISAKRGIQQESLVSSIALSRLSLPRLVPSRLEYDAPIESLPPKTALVTFLVSENQVHATMSVNAESTTWTLGSAARLPVAITSILRSIGAGKTRGSRLPEDESWRTNAATLKQQLFSDPKLFSDDSIEELIIVPDGALWYLPFAMLPVDGAESELLGDRVRIRYAPTPGFALQQPPEPNRDKPLALIASRFFAPREVEINDAISQTIVDAAEGTILMPNAQMPPPILYGQAISGLVVAAPLTVNPEQAFAWSVVPYEQANAGATLAGWMRFPSSVPSTVMLAGFRSQAETERLGDGREFFLTLCAMRTAGVRNVLLSRWAVGGESTAILLREFATERPFSSPFDAWNRAALVLRNSVLDPQTEPLLAHADKDRSDVTGAQPLFWAGYLFATPLDLPAP